jgi:hypothetical protein
MNLLNHYLDVSVVGVTIPAEFDAFTTNAPPSIAAGASACAPLNGGRNPNFLLFDWVDIGNVSAAVELLNGNATVVNGSRRYVAGIGYLWGLLMAFYEFYEFVL